MFTIKDILRIEVAPALGCTEPAAVALCAASAGSLLADNNLTSIDVWLSASIYKNAFAVAIPGTKGQIGIDLAAALGFYGGDPNLKLQVLEPIKQDHITTAKKLIQKKAVHVHLLEDKSGIYIRVKLTSKNEVAEAVIQGMHDNLVSLSYNEKPVTCDSSLLSHVTDDQSDLESLEEFLCEQSLEDLLVLVKQLDDEDMEFLREGVHYNLKLAEHGLDFGFGLGVGKTLDRLSREGLLRKDMVLSAKILTSAACDARMSGAKMAAMSSAGSGNHGLTAILPVWAVSKYLSDVEEAEVLKAIALSHVVTGYIKSHTGRLSAVCGCSIAAGAGATAAIAYLMGGNLNNIAGAIKNLLSDLAGVICDGAKAGCAFKLATAAGTAVQSALFSLHGIIVKETDGIVAGTPEQTMKNMGQISTKGMIDTDQTILQIMIDKKLTDKCLQCPQK